jgi:Dyp-type peroxidase family
MTTTATGAPATRTPLTVEQREDIQGFITSAYGHLPKARYLFFRITGPAAAREWLAWLIPRVTTGKRYHKVNGVKQKPQTAVNVALTRFGLEALGLPQQTLTSFPQEFYVGAAKRSAVLGDTDESAPEHWEFGGTNERGGSDLHGMVALYGANDALADRIESEYREKMEQSGGVEVIAREEGQRLPQEREAFGFVDGLSQPTIEGVANETDQDVIPTGEFILGFNNSYATLGPTPGVPAANDPRDLLAPFPGVPGWKDFGKNGTFLVYRKLQQDVAGFWKMIHETVERLFGPDLPADELKYRVAHFGAKIVGRWPNGAPVTLAPIYDDPELGKDGTLNNDFLYMDQDPVGALCPIGSHIRRSNPRDSLAKDDPAMSLKTTGHHRVLRRGIPYGPRVVDADDFSAENVVPIDPEPADEPRGLHFFALNAQIKRQFEFVQGDWINNPQFGGLFGAGDCLLANEKGNGGNVIFQRSPVRSSFAQIPRFITVKASGYFFIPSMTSLRYLASGDATAGEGGSR